MYAKIFHVSAKDLCICAKIQQMIVIQSSNNPIMDVLRSAQKPQVWNSYIPDKPLKFYLQSLISCLSYLCYELMPYVPVNKFLDMMVHFLGSVG